MQGKKRAHDETPKNIHVLVELQAISLDPELLQRALGNTIYYHHKSKDKDRYVAQGDQASACETRTRSAEPEPSRTLCSLAATAKSPVLAQPSSSQFSSST